MRNPFSAYEIEHLSPSTCTKFATSPAAFVLEKVLKRKGVVGAAAHRGTATEDGVVAGLMNPELPLAECQKIAHDKYAALTALSADHRVEKERDGISGMVEQGLQVLRPFGVPTATQGKVRLEYEGLLVPVIGFYDIEWEDADLITDLKTTFAAPSSIKSNHATQVSLYKICRNRGKASVTYVTPKKGVGYYLEEADKHLDALLRVAMTIQRFLSITPDPQELAQLVIPDVDHFYFTEPAMRQAAFETWGV